MRGVFGGGRGEPETVLEEVGADCRHEERVSGGSEWKKEGRERRGRGEGREGGDEPGPSV